MNDNMKYIDSETIVKEYKKLLVDEDITQLYISDKLGFSRQALNSLLKKKHMSFDDMQKLLNIIGYELEYKFVKK